MDYCVAAGVLELHISDHMPVYVIKKKDKEKRSKVSFRGRSYANYSKDLLSDSLTNRVKETFRSTYDPNECWELMQHFLENFLYKHCPIKTFRSKDNTPARITHDIITLSKDRDSAWKKAKRSGNEAD